VDNICDIYRMVDMTEQDLRLRLDCLITYELNATYWRLIVGPHDMCIILLVRYCLFTDGTATLSLCEHHEQDASFGRLCAGYAKIVAIRKLRNVLFACCVPNTADSGVKRCINRVEAGVLCSCCLCHTFP
jgi:hypothetical protein